jgi:small-conductance mechanosensitive channel
VLLEIARAHPQILQLPPPTVLLVNLAEKTMDFELRCIVANVERGASVKSDLHFALIRRFRESGIEIPYPAREVIQVVGKAKSGDGAEAAAGRA